VQPPRPPNPKRTAVWVTLGLLAALTGYVALRIVGPYLEALLAGAALATLFYPLHLRLLARLKWPAVTAVVSTVLVIVTVIVPLTFAVTAIIRGLRQANASGADDLWRTLDSLTAHLGLAPGELRSIMQSRIQEASSALLRFFLSAATAASGGVVQFVVAMGAFHFSLLNGEWLCEQIRQQSPLARERTDTLLTTIQAMIQASFYGVVAVALAQGTLLGVGAWIAGLPVPALWGLATMAVSVVPLIGSALVWIPGAILLLAQGHIAMGFFFLAWSAGLVANADNLVRPLVLMASLHVSGLVVFIAILGGIQAFGLLGIFVGPVTLAVGLALFRMLREEMQASDAGE
jgi:predicted PurR-regulated permease PerM